MQGKSTLNPHATPYVPHSNLSSDTCARRDKAPNQVPESSAKCEYFDVSSENLPESVHGDDIQSFEKLHVSGESSSKINQAYDIFQVELTDFVDQNSLNHPNTKLQYLSSMFPNFSVDSLSEVLNVHYDDIGETVDVLQQFECGGDEFEFPFETTEASINLGPESQKTSARRVWSMDGNQLRCKSCGTAIVRRRTSYVCNDFIVR